MAAALTKADKAAILAELDRLYPDARPELNFSNPYEVLVATMLSAQCTDVQVNKVTPAVFEKFPTVASMAETPVDVLFPMVKSCGFKSKAGNIIASCQQIMANHQGEVPDTMEALTALPGVGRKTANVVLANAYHIPTLAVDTHVFRVGNRIGLAKASTVERTEEQLKKAIPQNRWIDAHHQLIYHGRRVCKAQRPLCSTCTLAPWCRYLRSNPAPAPAARGKKESPAP